MSNLSPTVQARLEELCRAIVAEPQFEASRLHVDRFMIDDAARSQYAKVSEAGEHLHHKQSQGVQLSEGEVAAFEKEREVLLQNPVARAFLDAQESLHELEEGVNQFIRKTLELGRIPAPEDLEGSCGHGCGCHGKQ